MKNEVKKILEQLIGLELTRTSRTGGMECLKFGVFYQMDRKNIERQVGQFGLHLQCAWRITKNNTIIVGSDDLYEQPNENTEFDENFNWDVQGGNLRDVRLERFLKSGNLFVKSVEVDGFGGFVLFFTDDIELSIFPTLSTKSEYNEYWRLLDNRIDKKHYVVSIKGLSIV